MNTVPQIAPEAEAQPNVFSISSEQHLLAHLLGKPKKFISKVSSTLNPDNFYFSIHQQIFREMLTKGTDAISLNEEVKINNPDQGDYVLSLLQKSSGACDYKQISQTILNYYNLRLVYDSCQEALHRIENAECSEEVQVIKNDLQFSLDNSQTAIEVQNGSEVVNTIINDIDSNKHLEVFKTTDWLDEFLGGGFYRSKTYCFAGYMKAGKTTFLYTVSKYLSNNETKHAYIACEMGAKEIEMKGVNDRLDLSNITYVTQANASKLVDLSSEREFVNYVNAPSCTFDKLKSIISSLVYEHGIKVIMLDYIGLITGQPFQMSKAEWLSKVAQYLAEVARKLNIVIILASQLNRENKLKGSDGVAEACDFVAKIYESEDGNRTLQTLFTRYTASNTIGDDNVGGLSFSKRGSYFKHFQEF